MARFRRRALMPMRYSRFRPRRAFSVRPLRRRGTFRRYRRY